MYQYSETCVTKNNNVSIRIVLFSNSLEASVIAIYCFQLYSKLVAHKMQHNIHLLQNNAFKISTIVRATFVLKIRNLSVACMHAKCPRLSFILPFISTMQWYRFLAPMAIGHVVVVPTVLLSCNADVVWIDISGA